MHAKQFAFPCMTFCVCCLWDCSDPARVICSHFFLLTFWSLPHTNFSFFFEKQFCKITNVMNFMEMWCNLHNCISMHDILCVHYLWIDLFSRTCMCITSKKLPISFPKKKNCVSINAIEFLHRWCYGFSNEILTHVQHGNKFLICYAAWAFSGNM